eukprot:365554-Chlamydomonas_euryale.AAC.11
MRLRHLSRAIMKSSVCTPTVSSVFSLTYTYRSCKQKDQHQANMASTLPRPDTPPPNLRPSPTMYETGDKNWLEQSTSSCLVYLPARICCPGRSQHPFTKDAHLREGIHNDGKQEVEQHHEHKQLVSPKPERPGDALQTIQRAQLRVDLDVAEQDLKASIDRVPKRRKIGDDVAKDEVSHHRVADKDHARDNREVDEVWAGQPQGARDDAQARLEVHEFEHTRNEHQDVDPIERKVPVEQVHGGVHIAERAPRAGQPVAVVGQREVVCGGLHRAVHVVPQVDRERRGIVLHVDPPDDAARGEQAVGDELEDVPRLEEEAQRVVLLALRLHNLPERPQQHAVHHEVCHDLQEEPHVVVRPVVHLDAHRVEALVHADRAAVGELERGAEEAKHAQRRIVRDHLRSERVGVLVDEEALL